jgi:hypothetical protein
MSARPPIDVAALLALKRYEQPDPERLEACRRAVKRELLFVPSEPATATGWWLAFRLAAAAAFVAMLGFHWFSGPMAPEIAEIYQEEPMILAAEPVEEERLNPEFPLELLTNWPGRMSDGPIRFVSY